MPSYSLIVAISLEIIANIFKIMFLKKNVKIVHNKPEKSIFKYWPHKKRLKWIQNLCMPFILMFVQVYSNIICEFNLC